jgi:hypothetical protein
MNFTIFFEIFYVGKNQGFWEEGSQKEAQTRPRRKPRRKPRRSPEESPEESPQNKHQTSPKEGSPLKEGIIRETIGFP